MRLCQTQRFLNIFFMFFKEKQIPKRDFIRFISKLYTYTPNIIKLAKSIIGLILSRKQK